VVAIDTTRCFVQVMRVIIGDKLCTCNRLIGISYEITFVVASFEMGGIVLLVFALLCASVAVAYEMDPFLERIIIENRKAAAKAEARQRQQPQHAQKIRNLLGSKH
jgi:hypothetical protein